MRELAGLKVGLEYIKQQRENMKRKDVMDDIDDRVESSKIFAWSYYISESNYFLGFMGFAIVINTIVLSLD